MSIHFETLEEMKAWVISRPNYDYRFRPYPLGNSFHLYHREGEYSGTEIDFGDKLGEQVRAAFLESKSGARTLASVLKLLGCDVTKELKESRAEIKAELLKRRRNFLRSETNKKITALSKTLDELAKEDSKIAFYVNQIRKATDDIAPYIKEEAYINEEA